MSVATYHVISLAICHPPEAQVCFAICSVAAIAADATGRPRSKINEKNTYTFHLRRGRKMLKSINLKHAPPSLTIPSTGQ
jgi:hypothetical protein